MNSVNSIDQAMIEAMRAIDYTQPAVVRPYLEFGEIPSAEKALQQYYQDKAIEKKIEQNAKSIAEQETKLTAFLKLGIEIRSALEGSFAENKAKIEPRHLANLAQWAVDLEKTAYETSAEEAALLKRLNKNYKLVARKRPKYKTQLSALFERIFTVGDRKTEELYDMAAFLRGLRAEYELQEEYSEYFKTGAAMRAYLKGLSA